MKKKINSKYVLNSIFNYINDDKFKMKLFLYSKLFQNLFNLTILDYQLHFLNRTLKLNIIIISNLLAIQNMNKILIKII